MLDNYGFDLKRSSGSRVPAIAAFIDFVRFVILFIFTFYVCILRRIGSLPSAA